MSERATFLLACTLSVLVALLFPQLLRAPVVIAAPASTRVPYQGTVPHIFFHSLVVYPELAAAADPAHRSLLANNMVTVAEFDSIIERLYAQGYVLVDSRLQYRFDAEGAIHQQQLLLPPGKKPLILSVDDLDYYQSMQHDGMAEKLVLSPSGKIEAQVRTPAGAIIESQGGDVVPLIDAFIAVHPDFSLDGARGIIGVTGYEGILGYRTQLPGTVGDAERAAAAPVVAALKQEGWLFASHSYNHWLAFMNDSISSSTLAADIKEWQREVEPLVGPTDIFIGPYGDIFSERDPRRTQLHDAGFRVFYGVGIDGYEQYSSDTFAMDRINIDGLRLRESQPYLANALGL